MAKTAAAVLLDKMEKKTIKMLAVLITVTDINMNLIAGTWLVIRRGFHESFKSLEYKAYAVAKKFFENGNLEIQSN